jgi:microcystin-dependent protein
MSAKLRAGISFTDGDYVDADGLRKLIEDAEILTPFYSEQVQDTVMAETDLILFYDASHDRFRAITRANLSAGSGLDPASNAQSITQNNHGLAVGEVLYFDGTWKKAKADAAATSEWIGVIQQVPDANTFLLVTSGRILGLSGLTAGTLYYLSDATAGALTSTAPTAITSNARPVLLATSTTAGYLRGVGEKIYPPEWLPGDMKHTARATLEDGWLECDGTAKSRATFANLFAAIGTAFGAGDGSTTFNIPDAKGRALVGAGTGSGLTARAMGAKFGAESMLLTAAHLKNLTFQVDAIYDSNNSGSIFYPWSDNTTQSGDHTNANTTIKTADAEQASVPTIGPSLCAKLLIKY